MVAFKKTDWIKCIESFLYVLSPWMLASLFRKLCFSLSLDSLDPLSIHSIYTSLNRLFLPLSSFNHLEELPESYGFKFRQSVCLYVNVYSHILYNTRFLRTAFEGKITWESANFYSLALSLRLVFARVLLAVSERVLFFAGNVCVSLVFIVVQYSDTFFTDNLFNIFNLWL